MIKFFIVIKIVSTNDDYIIVEMYVYTQNKCIFSLGFNYNTNLIFFFSNNYEIL